MGEETVLQTDKRPWRVLLVNRKDLRMFAQQSLTCAESGSFILADLSDCKEILHVIGQITAPDIGNTP
jgi:hypothetical protein